MMDTIPQPAGSAEYVRVQGRPRHAFLISILIACIALTGGAAWGYMRYLTIDRQMRADENVAALIAEQRARFADALVEANVTPAQIATGFWYTYTDAEGNEHVLYFDPQALARQNLTDAQLKQLAEVVSKSEIADNTNMRTLAEEELPSVLQFNNAIYSFGDKTANMKRILLSKEKNGTVSSDELLELSYLYELEGNYAERDAVNRENCVKFEQRCNDAGTIMLSGRVVDDAGSPVQGARVEIVSRPDVAPVETDSEGIYRLKSGVKVMEKLRVRASKRNFSDGYVSVILVVGGVKVLSVDDIVLESPLTIVTVDFGKHTVTGSGNRFTPDGAVVVTTPNSTYEIPADAIVGKDGKPYREPIDVYLYEFTKGNPPESLMQVDTFDQVIGYAGNLMKTFGMPYIQFFTEDGIELDVRKSNPMVLTYRIADMDALRANTDQIYEPLTDADMQLLVSASLGQPYRIDREFLINNQLLRFPAFWVFDRKRGVWDNVGVSVLDTEGTIRSIFYTVRDNM